MKTYTLIAGCLQLVQDTVVLLYKQNTPCISAEMGSSTATVFQLSQI